MILLKNIFLFLFGLIVITISLIYMSNFDKNFDDDICGGYLISSWLLYIIFKTICENNKKYEK